MKRLSVKNFGHKAQGVELRGDPRSPEPECFRIRLPGATVEVVRARDEPDSDYVGAD